MMNREIEPAEIEAALATILADDKFAAAPQMSAFLAYVVKQSLLGEADRIKAYTVAVDALGKPATFDPQNDPSVRVLAKRLRSSLEHYYERTHGHEVIIELKSGSYRPLFVRGESPFDAAAGQSAGSADPTGHTVQDSDAVTPGGADTTLANAHAGGAVTTTATDPAEATVSASSTEPSGSRKWYSAMARTPTPALALVAVAAVGWAVSSQQVQQTLRDDLAEAQAATRAFDTTTDAGPMHIALASSSTNVVARARPDVPTVFVPRSVPGDTLQARIANSMASVMSRFDLVDVVRRRSQASGGQWPEEYELSVSAHPVEGQHAVEIQLLHSTTGRVAHVESLRLAAGAETFNGEGISTVERVAARLANDGGPLIRDYRRQGNVTPALSCLFATAPSATTDGAASATVDDTSAVTADNLSTTLCSPETAGHSDLDVIPTIYQAQALIADTADDAPGHDPDKVDRAFDLAHQAVAEAPYSAQAQVTMMQVLAHRGELTDALDHGQRAVNLNPFDAVTLRRVASVMEAMGKTSEARGLRQRAQDFDPLAARSI